MQTNKQEKGNKRKQLEMWCLYLPYGASSSALQYESGVDSNLLINHPDFSLTDMYDLFVKRSYISEETHIFASFTLFINAMKMGIEIQYIVNYSTLNCKQKYPLCIRNKVRLVNKNKKMRIVTL